MLSIFEKHNKICWLLVIVIAVAIFYISTLTFGPTHTGSSIKSFLYHFFSFFFLAFFLLPALVRGKSKFLILITIILAILYGISDEVHQIFVPFRYFSFLDILTNSLGILVASFIYTLALKRRIKAT